MITISPGHWHVGTGAVGYIDEVTEARRVVNGVKYGLQKRGVACHIVVDTRSRNQRENIAYLLQAHRATTRVLDVSIHFNASRSAEQRAIGTEVLYAQASVAELATALASRISAAGTFICRGAKYRSDVAILQQTGKPTVLIEVCFVNSKEDVRLYKQHFRAICEAIADTLSDYILGKI